MDMGSVLRDETIELIENGFSRSKEKKLNQIKLLKEWRESGKKICAFGAGSGGCAIAISYENLGIGIDYFCDNDPDKWGKVVYNDIKCISPKELSQLGDEVICTISVGTEVLEEIYKQLIAMGMRHVYKHCESQVFSEVVSDACDYDLDCDFVRDQVDKLFDLFIDEESRRVLLYKFRHIIENGEELNSLNYADIFSPNQYFIERGKYLRKGERITDCGSFDGDTLDYLINRIGFIDFDSYTCYEPDEKNVAGIMSRIDGYDKSIRDKITVMPYAVADRRRSISIDTYGNNHVDAVPLDEYLSVHGTTFLKMDIEGAEMDALRGAEKLLSQEQPNCAVCVYHRISDMWNVPMFLHEKLPNHSLFLRHHQYSFSETVCYALRVEG